jgi:hypothetical protein
MTEIVEAEGRKLTEMRRRSVNRTAMDLSRASTSSLRDPSKA